MNTKLTLNIDKTIIDQAKIYAQETNQSLSSLIQNFLSTMIEESNKKDIHISPAVRELSGIIRLPDDFDHKKEYRKHITKKYNDK